ncbi:hypothetical protein D1841_17280 [Neglecta sp. X4]|nr:hypothetical protein [Neglectibacter sp. 59]NBJ74893.1 hypothetical protein [Neglectibacter sp. X4]NCE82687.1 hypothetical protein [Neglectibacter sp. X58]
MAFENLTVELPDNGGLKDLRAPVLEVSLQLVDDRAETGKYTKWLLQDSTKPGTDGDFVTQTDKLAFSLDGGKTLIPFDTPVELGNLPVGDDMGFSGAILTAQAPLDDLTQAELVDPDSWNPETSTWRPLVEDVYQIAELYVEGSGPMALRTTPSNGVSASPTNVTLMSP